MIIISKDDTRRAALFDLFESLSTQTVNQPITRQHLNTFVRVCRRGADDSSPNWASEWGREFRCGVGFGVRCAGWFTCWDFNTQPTSRVQDVKMKVPCWGQTGCRWQSLNNHSSQPTSAEQHLWTHLSNLEKSFEVHHTCECWAVKCPDFWAIWVNTTSPAVPGDVVACFVLLFSEWISDTLVAMDLFSWTHSRRTTITRWRRTVVPAALALEHYDLNNMLLSVMCNIL